MQPQCKGIAIGRSFKIPYSSPSSIPPFQSVFQSIDTHMVYANLGPQVFGPRCLDPLNIASLTKVQFAL